MPAGPGGTYPRPGPTRVTARPATSAPAPARRAVPELGRVPPRAGGRPCGPREASQPHGRASPEPRRQRRAGPGTARGVPKGEAFSWQQGNLGGRERVAGSGRKQKLLSQREGDWWDQQQAKAEGEFQAAEEERREVFPREKSVAGSRRRFPSSRGWGRGMAGIGATQGWLVGRGIHPDGDVRGREQGWRGARAPGRRGKGKGVGRRNQKAVGGPACAPGCRRQPIRGAGCTSRRRREILKGTAPRGGQRGAPGGWASLRRVGVSPSSRSRTCPWRHGAAESCRLPVTRSRPSYFTPRLARVLRLASWTRYQLSNFTSACVFISFGLFAWL